MRIPAMNVRRMRKEISRMGKGGVGISRFKVSP